ncbi:MAG: hypothetical protein Salg2KO_19250 [Salibacteraceae bacterium]
MESILNIHARKDSRDSLGQLVHDQLLSKTIQLDIANGFNSGVYLISIQTSVDIISTRFVVNK